MNNRKQTSWRRWILFGWCFFAGACESRQIVKDQSVGIPDSNATPVLMVNQGDGGKQVKLKIPNYPLRSEKDLDILMQQIGDARVVLLGEASHGTSEYYLWRAAISKRLIQEKGFDFISVEGEWADSYRVNNL